MQRVICTNCRARVEAAPRYNFVGLLRFDCPHCRKHFLYPMSPRRRKAYIAIAVLFSILCAAAMILAGSFVLPGILPAAAVVGLIQDSNARAKIEAAESSAPPFQA
jgi:hypothetical protein